MTKKKTTADHGQSPCFDKTQNRGLFYVAHVLKPPEGLQGRCRLHKIPPSELGGFLKKLADRSWNSSAFHTILRAFVPIYARTTVFSA